VNDAPGRLTVEERTVMDFLVEAHSAFADLPRQHPGEMDEWNLYLHLLQNLLLMRPTVRAEGWVK
jgi:hypothetical protein